MRRVHAITCCAALVLIAGCADRDRVYGSIYEGLKTRKAIVHPSTEQKPAEKSVSYPEYEAERKKLLGNGDSR